MEAAEQNLAGLLDLTAGSFELLREVKDYAIYLIDPDGVVLTWNDGARAIKGYTPDEIVGHHFSRFFTAEDRADGRPDRLLAIARAEGRVEDQAWRIRKDGTRFWADVVITAIHEKSGRVQGFVKVTRDLTERRRGDELLRQSEERLRLLIEGVKDYAIFMLDLEGNILSWNRGAEGIKGYRADEVIGQHFSIFYPAELRERGHPQRELEIATQEGRYEEEGVRVRKNGDRFWANVVLTAVYEPGTTRLRGFAKVTRDLTERRRAEQAMQSASEQISMERVRTEEARAALKARDEFIAVAAHELRTPLASLLLKVQGARSLTLDRAPGEGAGVLSKLSDRLDGAVRQIGRMTGLVERLLDVSRIVRGTLPVRFRETNMSTLVRRVVDDVHDAAVAAGCAIRLTTSERAEGCWDEARIEQVVGNVLSNALKYGSGKPIEVNVDGDEQSVRVIVSDQGIGIEPHDVDRIFDRFERAVSVENYSGLGLGLYIAKSIVDAHQGSIRILSFKGQGSAFTIELPRRPTEPVV